MRDGLPWEVWVRVSSVRGEDEPGLGTARCAEGKSGQESARANGGAAARKLWLYWTCLRSRDGLCTGKEPSGRASTTATRIRIHAGASSARISDRWCVVSAVTWTAP